MAISVTDFTLAAPSGLTVKTATLAALDTSGAVTHGVVTESATPPVVGDASWVAWNGADGTRPAGLQSQTLTAGAHTLYGHVKDAAGNRGSSAGQATTVAAGGPILVANPSFGSALGGATISSANWHAFTSGNGSGDDPPAEATVDLTGTIDGAAARLWASGGFDMGLDDNTTAEAKLSQRIMKATIDASNGILGPFKMKPIAGASTSSVVFKVTAKRSGTADTALCGTYKVYGASGSNLGSFSMGSTPASGWSATYTAQAGLKQIVTDAPGVIGWGGWSAVEYVDVSFEISASGPSGGAGLIVDSFPTS